LFDLSGTRNVDTPQTSALFIQIDLMLADRTTVRLLYQILISATTLGHHTHYIGDNLSAPLHNYSVMETKITFLDKFSIV